MTQNKPRRELLNEDFNNNFLNIKLKPISQPRPQSNFFHNPIRYQENLGNYYGDNFVPSPYFPHYEEETLYHRIKYKKPVINPIIKEQQRIEQEKQKRIQDQKNNESLTFSNYYATRIKHIDSINKEKSRQNIKNYSIAGASTLAAGAALGGIGYLIAKSVKNKRLKKIRNKL